MAEGEDGGPREGLAAAGLFSRRIGLILVVNLIGSVAAILVLPMLTRSMPASDFGVYTQVTVTAILAPLLLGLGLPWAMVRFLASEDRRERVSEGLSSVLTVVVAVSLAAAAALAALAPQVGTWLFGGREDVIRLTAVLVPLECTSAVLYNYLRAFQRIRLFSAFILMQTLLLLGLIAVTVVLGMGLVGAVLALLGARAATVVAMAVAVLREVPLRRPDFSMLRQFLRFGTPMVPSDLSEWAMSSVDRYLIGIIAGITWVGYYGPGYALGSILLLFVVPLRFLLPPALSEMYDRGHVDRARAFLRYSMKYFLVLTIPGAVGLGLLARPLLLLLTTEEIAREGHVVVPVVAMAMVLCGAQAILAQVLLLQKRTRTLGAVMGVSAVLNVAVNVAAIPRFEILGAALATLVAYLFATLATGALARGEPRVEVDVVAVGKSVVATMAMAAVVVAMDRWWDPSVLVWTVSAALAGAGVFAGVTALLRTFSREELDFARALLRRRPSQG